MLKLWVDCVCPQMSVGELSATGQQSIQQGYFIAPAMFTHIQHVFRQANFACHCCTPFFSKQKAFCSISLIGLSAPGYPAYYSTTVPSFRFRVDPTGNKVAPLSGRVSALQC